MIPLTLDHVTLLLGDGDSQVTALDDVSLRVEPGEFLAVMGPSGSGKSSLLAVAGALVRPTSGQVFVGDTELTALTDRQRTALRRARIGYVFQSSNLVPALTVREQLHLIAHLNGRVTAEDRRRADDLIDAVGMAGKADRRPHELSGGERQRVGIARGLMSQPAVLLVDEPTSALDHRRAAEIVGLLAAQAHERRTATVMVTHDAGVVGDADRVIRMLDGRQVVDAAA